MKLTTKACLSILLANLLIAGINGVPYAQSASAPPVWVSNTAYAKQLGPEIKIDNFSVSPPIGFHLKKTIRKSDDRVFTDYKWVGPKRADGSHPNFRVAVIKFLPGYSSNDDADQWLLDGLGAMNIDGKHYIHTSVVHGRIRGMNFVRAYWRRDPAQVQIDKKQAFHGFQYLSSQGSTVVVVMGDDVHPYYKSTLDMMEAATLTLHQ